MALAARGGILAVSIGVTDGSPVCHQPHPEEGTNGTQSREARAASDAHKGALSIGKRQGKTPRIWRDLSCAFHQFWL